MEAMNMKMEIQGKSLNTGGAVGQAKFVASLFGIAAYALAHSPLDVP